MTRSYRSTRRIVRRRTPRYTDPSVASLGFTCFRLDSDFEPVELLFPRLSMATLIRAPQVAWITWP
jgi:hypothetical protein